MYPQTPTGDWANAGEQKLCFGEACGGRESGCDGWNYDEGSDCDCVGEICHGERSGCGAEKDCGSENDRVGAKNHDQMRDHAGASDCDAVRWKTHGERVHDEGRNRVDLVWEYGGVAWDYGDAA